jgi:isoleucyl-tRNA synthetase
LKRNFYGGFKFLTDSLNKKGENSILSWGPQDKKTETHLDFYEIIDSEESVDKYLVGLKYEPLYPFMSDLLPADQKSKLENAFQVYAADFVTTTDGTGIVHIAPMYGADDFELGTKHNLPKFHVVNEEGKYISGCDTDAIKLSGRYVKESDECR